MYWNAVTTFLKLRMSKSQMLRINYSCFTGDDFLVKFIFIFSSDVQINGGIVLLV